MPMPSTMEDAYSPDKRTRTLKEMEGLLRRGDGSLGSLGEAALRAIVNVPHLVHLESDPMVFLQMYERIPEATRHLAEYWNKRVQVFGERAYLPMTLTGNGALSSEDVLAYKQFGFYVLTKHNGSTVAFYDQCVFDQIGTLERDRCAFYSWSILVNTQNFEKGVILLASISDTITFDKETASWLSVFPVFVSSIYLFSQSEPLKPLEVEQKSRVLVFSSLDAFQRSRELVSAGYHPGELPEPLGGTFGRKQINHWFDTQLDLEYEKYPDLHCSDDDDSSSGASVLYHQPQTDDRDGYTRIGMRNPELSEETEELIQEHLKRFQAALDQTNDPGKPIYQQALNVAPLIVETEAPPIKFLRVCNFDAPQAVNRMIQYWKLRQDLFGERAFLPMTQTGDGALTEDDVLVLSSGAIASLPHDANGRSVVISDRNRSLGALNANKDSKWRCFFYMFSVAAENALSQSDGFVFIGVLVTPRVVEFYEAFATKCMEICACMPARLKACHFLMKPPKVGKKGQIEEMVAKARNIVKSSNGDCSLFHSALAPDELLLKLEPFGLCKEGLPVAAGGEYKYEEFTKWQKRRRAHEHTSVRSIETGVAKPGDEHDEDAGDKEIQKDRKRKLNVIHSRQKRERRRAEMEKLQVEGAALRSKNNGLRVENARLESLLQDVIRKVRSSVETRNVAPVTTRQQLVTDVDIRRVLALRELGRWNELVSNARGIPATLADLTMSQHPVSSATSDSLMSSRLNTDLANLLPLAQQLSVPDSRLAASLGLTVSGLPPSGMDQQPPSSLGESKQQQQQGQANNHLRRSYF